VTANTYETINIMLNTPFSPWPSFTEEEANAVRNVLLSSRVNYWTGDECREFEKEFSAWSGAGYSIAMANGTVALDVALKAVGIGPGDEVVVTPRTFIASVSCVVNAGAIPVFAEVDPDSGNISAETIERVLSVRTKALICVHLAGWPCDMDPVMRLADQYGFFVIEDCAQAHGARYKRNSVGVIGHIGTWSFCQDKIMTTGGEGGMVTTNDYDLWLKMWSFKDHGKSWEAVYEQEHFPGFRWLHESFGTNWRMTEMQAAIGRIQLRWMVDWHRVRSDNAKVILDACEKFPLLFRVPRPPEHSEHGWYKCYLYVRSDGLKQDWSRDRIIEEIINRGVPCYSGSCSEVYLEKAFDETGFRPKERLLLAKELGETSLMFLVHPTLTTEEIELTGSTICNVASLAGR
jgi:dTDP-4-amino-4,6-dideoxygalactose transaminase